MSPAGLTAIAIGIAFAIQSSAPDSNQAATVSKPPASAAQAPAVRRVDNPVLHVEITGHGRPLLLIPGLATSGEVWRDAVARLARDYECHAVTLGGFAGQPRYEGPFLDTARDSLLAYLRTRGLARPVVVGHSLGGVLALRLAIAAPEAIGPVVVLDAVPFLGGLGQPQATAASVRSQMEPMRRMIAGQSQEAYAEFQRSSGHLRGIVTRPDDYARVLAWASTSKPAAVADAMTDVYATDLREAVAAVRSPLLVLGSWYGFKDFTTREAVERNYRDQYARVPRWSFAMADSARHFLMLDDPDWTWGQTGRFLDSLATAGSRAGAVR